METSYFQKYITLKDLRRKVEADSALEKFLASFINFDEKDQWTRSYLNSIQEREFEKLNRKLFASLIYPVLLTGYHNNDPWSYRMLMRFMANLYQDKRLHEQIGYKSEYTILREGVQKFPNERDFSEKLLQKQIEWFRYCEHEWPMGILHGLDGANMSGTEELLTEVALSRRLDLSRDYAAFLDRFEQRVREYQGRL